jgi:hypothetical protein
MWNQRMRSRVQINNFWILIEKLFHPVIEQ